MVKILIVDDSNFSQKVVSRLLNIFLHNADIYFANDGQEGFDTYKNTRPNYVFADLLMPTLDGKSMIKLIKEYDDQANIFVISADVQKSVREEMEKYNIIEFINKPLNQEKAKLICDRIRNDIE
jgi:two-component system, chemotaxis family, chemotaxis protein CheY